MKAIIATLGICASFAASAVELHPQCHRLYEMFNLPDLIYDDVGKIADKMHENGCWPVLQGLMPAAAVETQLPDITNCDSLAPHIVQMTQDQTTPTNPSVVKLSGVRSLDREFCVFMGVVEGSEAVQEEPKFWLNYSYSQRVPADFFNACAGVIGAKNAYAVPGEKPMRPLECRGTAKYTVGQDRAVYFYVERFSDGDEFVGISPIMQ